MASYAPEWFRRILTASTVQSAGSWLNLIPLTETSSTWSVAVRPSATFPPPLSSPFRVHMWTCEVRSPEAFSTIQPFPTTISATPGFRRAE